MYRCGLCGHCSQPNQPRLLHVVERMVPEGYQVHKYRHGGGTYSVKSPPRKEIAREIPVCRECSSLLQEGLTVRQVAEMMCRKRAKEVEADEVSTPRKRSKSQDWASQAVPLSDVMREHM
jgi:hypothetical protein